MRWTPDQLRDYMTQFHKPANEIELDTPDDGPESRLQAKIEKWCSTWGRPCLSFRQSKAAKRMLPAGWPDIEIIMPRGKTLRIELKSASGRLKKEQIQLKLQFMSLGHTVHEIRSFRKFLEVVNDTKRDNL